MLKNKKFFVTAILPVIISVILGIVIVSVNNNLIINMRANATINNEKEQMQKDINDFEDKKISLQYTAADLDKKIEDDRILFEEIQALKKELEDYNTDIADAKTTIDQLDKNISEKTKYNANLDKLNNQSEVSEKTYTNIKLNVPGDVSAGRYIATGKGKIYIYTIANTLQEKQDLSLLDSNSYTFSISSGQYIKIEGTITLTNIK